MRIIIESEIVEDNDAEVLQDFDGSSLDVFADDVSTFLITQITIFEIAATIGIGQSCKRGKVFLAILLPIRADIETSTKIGSFTILEETNAICCRFYMIDLRSQLHG